MKLWNADNLPSNSEPLLHNQLSDKVHDHTKSVVSARPEGSQAFNAWPNLYIVNGIFDTVQSQFHRDAGVKEQQAAAAASNSVLQDALDHALQEMESVRMAVSSQAGASQGRCRACSAAAYPSGQGLNQDALAAHEDDLALKSERIRELQRELAATLNEKDTLQAELESLEQLAQHQ